MNMFSLVGLQAKRISKIVSLFLLLSVTFSYPLLAFSQVESDSNLTNVIENAQVQPSQTTPLPLELNFLIQTDKNTSTEPKASKTIDPVDFPKSDIEVDSNKNLNLQLSALSSSVPSNSYFDSPKSVPQLKQDQYGAFVYSYPIIVPPGREKTTPSLELVYSSGFSDTDSVFGYGWTINIPYIERINRMGLNKIYSNDYYYSSLDGELASTSSNAFTPLVENGQFYKYSYSTTTGWIVKDKQGLIYKFGTSTSSRQDDPSDNTKVYKWMLSEIRDSNNNYITFYYYKNSGQIYPDAITYSGNGSNTGIFKINFLRESRNDNFTSYRTGFAVASNYRINEIDTLVSGSWVRKYELAYISGDNSKRSLLSSLTESGIDDTSTVISLPVTSFSYSTSTYSWTQTSGYAWNVSGSIDGGSGVTFLDVNGDGFTDYVSASPSNKSVAINNGQNSFVNDSGWVVPGNINVVSDYDSGYRFGDVNGDALPDIIYSNLNGATASSTVYINNGTNWVYDSSWSGLVPAPFVYINGSTKTICTVNLNDVNGDDLMDIMMSLCPGSGTWLNNGHGWTATQSFNWVSGDGDGNGLTYIDVNGDGLVDRVLALSSSGRSVSINNGKTGWDEDVNWNVPGPINDSSSDLGFRFGDVNGDGLVDLVRSWNNVGVGSSTIYFNTGANWVKTTDASMPINSSFTYTPASGPTINNATVLVDINGDTLPDLVHGSNGGPTAETHTKDNFPADMLKTVTNSNGGITIITYTPSTQYFDVNSKLNAHLPFIIKTVSSVVNNNGLGVIASSTYSYGGGLFYYNSAFNKKFAGFATTTETDESGSIIKKYFHQGNQSNSSIGEYDDNYYKIGKYFRFEKYDKLNNLYSKTINKWDTFQIGTSSYYVKLTQTVESEYDGNSSHKDIASSFVNDNTTGNLTGRIIWGEVNGNDDGSFSDVGSDKASSTIAYTASSTGYLILPSQEVNYNQSSIKVKESKYYYDGLASGLTNGNLSKLELWKISSLYSSTTKTYNSYGLVTQDKDPRGNATNYTYDPYNLYVSTSTNALAQNTAYTYDYSSGKVKQTIDPNSRVFQNIYDGLDRLIEIKQPDIANPASIVTKTSFTFTDNTLPSKVQETNYLNSATSSDKYSYLDGFGRKVQERQEAEGNNTYIVKDYIYGINGKLESDSLPYFASSTAWSTPTVLNSLYNNYYYDALGRVISINNSVGTTTNTYDDWRLTVVDPRSKTKDFYSDSYRNLINVVEHNNGVNATTTYTYDLNKNLTTITDGAGNLRNFTYDGLNRRLTAQDLHASGDATYGIYTYVYDDSNNLTQKIDPKSQTINYTYDELNRPLTEDYTGSSGTEITYTYDNGTDGKGRLTTASSTDSKIYNSYNALGAIKFSTTTISGISYANEFDYDRLGNYTYIGYPDGSKVKYWYNSAGQLESIIQRENGGSYITLVSNYDYSPTGKVSLKDFGNGVETRYTYDQNGLYRLTNILTISGGMGGSLEDMIVESSSTPEIVLDESTSSDEIKVVPEENKISTTSIVIDLIQPEIATSTEGSILSGNTDIAVATTSIETEPELLVRSTVEDYVVKLQPVEIVSRGALEGSGEIKTKLLKDMPKIVLEKWNGEVSLGVAYNGILPNTKSKAVSSKQFEWVDGEEKLEAITLEPLNAMEDGGVKVNVVLNSKPTKNKFNFQFENYENLDFLYQDALWKENGLKESTKECSDTDCVKSNGRHYFRPENIVGSYAVYYKNKQGYEPGQLNYGTGKVFHIYRPLIIDSSGNKIWGDLNYKDGELSVTVPQDFLDKATYPVTVDPTFGYTNVGASTNDFGGNVLYAKANSTPASNGSLTSMSIYGKILTGSPNFNPALYSNSGNAPSTRLANVDSGGTNYGSSPAWVTTNISYGGITSGTQYWLGFKSADVGPLINYDSGGTETLHYGFGASWNSTADDVGNEGGIYSIYATYTASSSPSSPTVLQNISYTYDANGNITQLIDSTDTGIAKTVAYSYDDLNRLITASTTSATSTPYRYQWTYDVLGNITAWNNGTATTTYSYAGNTGSLYANPHAATSIVDNANTDLISATNLTTGQDVDGGSIATTTSVTPGSNKLLLLTVNARTNISANTNQPTVSGNGLTWVLVNDILYDTTSTSRKRISVFRAMASNPTSGPITINYGGQNQTNIVWSLSELSGIDTSGTNGSGAIVQSATNKDESISTGSLTVTLGSFSNTNNSTYGAFAADNSVNFTPTAGSGFSLLGSIHSTSGASEIEIADEFKSNNDTTVDLTWSGSSMLGGVAIEIKKASSTTATSTLVYDNSGNVTSQGNNSYAWNYRNFLTQFGTGISTSTYMYDDTGQRVKMITPAGSIYYPSKFYSISTTTVTKQIFANGELLATVQGTSTNAAPFFVHTDHLNGTNVVTDSTGLVSQTLDYYPYGSERIITGSNKTDRHYIGERYDESSGLNYLNARYYSGTNGKFISQDPVFWEIGITDDGKKALLDPQLQNSYSYASNNPIINKDPNGRQSVTMVLGGGGVSLSSLAYLGPYGLVIGAGVATFAASYYGTQYVLNNSQRLIETVQLTNYAELRFPGKGSDPNDFKDPKGGMSFWQKVIYTGLGIGVGAEAYHEVMEKMFKNETSSNNSTPTSQLKTFSGYNSLNTSQKSQLTNPHVQSSQALSVVSQNGIIYVRNSSGLLNFADTNRTK